LIRSSAAALAAPAILSALAPNNQIRAHIRAGIIGVGGRGSNLLNNG
jgi:hypothetical protein